MIDPDTAFIVAQGIALIAWIALLAALFAQRIRNAVWRATGLLVPGAMAVAYVILAAAGIGEAGGTDFASLAEVRRVFAGDSALAAGWMHYLAFDMVVGTWMARDGIEREIPAVLLLPCLLLTFVLGPTGFLLYLLLRLARRSQRASAMG